VAPYRDTPRGHTALLILDMITEMDFAGAVPMRHEVAEAAATILKLRYGLEGDEPLTLKQIGSRVGLTRERVRQIEQDTLQRLRVNLSGRK